MCEVCYMVILLKLEHEPGIVVDPYNSQHYENLRPRYYGKFKVELSFIVNFRPARAIE